ncbi:MAG: alpha/beta hydrolase [Desulfobulbaceae bacterium]|nr:alpha/beta hydrolase [Desulfobulbaceae bacterium]
MSRGGGMLHFFGPLVVIGGLLYFLLCTYLYFMQARMLFYPGLPGRDLRAKPTDIGLEYESVHITTSDSIRLHGWFVKAGRERGTLLFFHGNAGNISHRLDSLRIFNTLGLSVLIIDYRGYGQSQGRISETGTYLDAEAAWQYLTEQKRIDPQNIILFGRSLGGAIAANLAAKHPPAALILESVFSSVPDMAARFYPVFPVRLLARFNYDTRKSLASVYCPVLVIHSPDDEIIPFENGRILFETAREPKSFLEIHGGHNEGFLASGPFYVKGLENFINENLSKQE